MFKTIKALGLLFTFLGPIHSYGQVDVSAESKVPEEALASTKLEEFMKEHECSGTQPSPVIKNRDWLLKCPIRLSASGEYQLGGGDNYAVFKIRYSSEELYSQDKHDDMDSGEASLVSIGRVADIQAEVVVGKEQRNNTEQIKSLVRKLNIDLLQVFFKVSPHFFVGTDIVHIGKEKFDKSQLEDRYWGVFNPTLRFIAMENSTFRVQLKLRASLSFSALGKFDEDQEVLGLLGAEVGLQGMISYKDRVYLSANYLEKRFFRDGSEFMVYGKRQNIDAELRWKILDRLDYTVGVSLSEAQVENSFPGKDGQFPMMFEREIRQSVHTGVEVRF